jgi:lysophospholipid acyltransferase (LPLAT)-like uncharacterized protein
MTAWTAQIPKLTVRVRSRQPLHGRTQVCDILASLLAMAVRLVELTPENVKAACDVQVKPEQQKFVAQWSSHSPRLTCIPARHGRG